MTFCADASRDQAESLAGTAATARTWLLLEQPGPWGAKALTQSRLDPALGRFLESAPESGVRAALIRRPGRDARLGGARRVLLAHTPPGRAWVRTALIDDPEELRALDLAALAAGDHGGFGEPHPGGPVALVCTNGRRDRCCAMLGRPLAAELAAAGHDVWETTHIGGHRFSPTLLTLPHGYAWGRMSAATARHVLAELGEGRTVVDGCRGRSCWPRPAQAAELAVRRYGADPHADALEVVDVVDTAGDDTVGTAGEPRPGRWRVTVARLDGRQHWEATVAEKATLPASPASCGAAALPQSRMEVLAVRPLLPASAD
ncbi:sucrase ferredoxin [Streptomyces lonarensis]|uniref:Sucrase ferredoxin n=1 Tax=Streptomyces lonarensis TaxID=700599 RepID=A0A7X6HY14_9ACTN|nr:sucrase ferredoxin [Streptomyces lonarensis]NJQ04920.1 sucrase ferredoxin [Streptomyces lonarensis]